MKQLDMTSIGRSIKGYRNFLGLTQSELAQKVNISPSAIGMYEQGRRTPPVDVLYNISQALNVNFLDLIPELKKQYTNEHDRILSHKLEQLELNYTEQKHSNKSKQLDTIAAHLDADKLSDEDIEDITQFINFVQNKKD